jgi:hypothetical protein
MVDLPHPEAPTKATLVPFFISRLNSLKTLVFLLSYLKERFSMTMWPLIGEVNIFEFYLTCN